MKILLAFLILLIISSCGLLRKYPDNEDVRFDKCLSKDEKKIINQNKQFYINWDGINNNGGYSRGLLQVREDSLNSNRFLFIKNGLWTEYHKLPGGRQIKILENHDRFGNIIFGQTFISSKDTLKGFTLIFEEISDSLQQTNIFKRYYDNGKIKYINYSKSLNFEDYLSSSYKGYSLDSTKTFNSDGIEVDPKEIDTYDMLYYRPSKCKK